MRAFDPREGPMPASQPRTTDSPPPQSPAARALSGKWPHALFIAAVLLFTVATRILLVARGGQHFFYDEGKFGTATEAAAILAKGHAVDAVVYAIEPHLSTFA